MRLNKYLALATGLSRRAADDAIAHGRIQINGTPAVLGQAVNSSDTITLDGQRVYVPDEHFTTIMLHKPVGYVTSRRGQGSQTIYDLLPPAYHHLKPVGRLDKNSSGLLILTNDGQLAFELTHPSHRKAKIYELALDRPLAPLHRQMITDYGILLDDDPSKFMLEQRGSDRHTWRATLYEGRNRQIRRTFTSLGYRVTKLHRTHFGPYHLPASLPAGKFETI